MKSESPFQKITFSAFLFLLKLSVSHNDHEMLSSIRNTLFTESLQIEFITRNSVVSCHPLPRSHTGLALNSAWLCPRGRALCSGSSAGAGCHCRKVGPRFGSSLRREQSSGQKLDNGLLQPSCVWEPRVWPGPWAAPGACSVPAGNTNLSVRPEQGQWPQWPLLALSYCPTSVIL